MPNEPPHRHEGKLWLIAATLAFLTLALGLWDLFVERDGGENWLTQALLPLLFLVYTLAMYRRQRRSVTDKDTPPTSGRA